MGEIDLFGEYVRDRLEEWGREFALGRDCEYLGHQSKNMLQVLIEHKGEMPARAQGYKPLEVSQTALQIERIVMEIARDQVRMACCLRGYYCGAGRRKVERYEVAASMIDRIVPRGTPLKVHHYMAMVNEGRAVVRGALIGIARAA